MKNISNPSSNRFWAPVCFGLVLVLSAALNGADRFDITERRAGYFILHMDARQFPQLEMSKGKTGFLFTRSGSHPVGRFTVLDITPGPARGPDLYLCRIQADSPEPGIDAAMVSHAAFASIAEVSRNGMKFRPLPAEPGSFLSVKAVPLRDVSPPDISGVKQLLFAIEAGGTYSAFLIPFGRIRALDLQRYIDFTDPDALYLGTNDGKPCMIYDGENGLAYTELSDTTLRKFRQDLRVPILLRRKENQP